MVTATATRVRPAVSVQAASLPVLPALVDGRTMHRRFSPIASAFSHRIAPWLVDVDALPQAPRLLRAFTAFRAQDHLGDGAAGGLRGDVDAVLARAGITPDPGGRVIMLAQPRTLGHTFNPLSVFWCFDASGALLAVILEVHNTYGQRHVYVIGPDGQKALIDKAFYVSPFNDLRGGYRVVAELSEHWLRVTIALERDGAAVFSAGLNGTFRPATRGAVIRRALGSPLAAYRVSALIRWHGIRLWLRRLPVQPRPPVHPEVLG